MLNDLVNGKESSRFIVVHDSLCHRGDCILKYITQEFLNRFDAVIAFVFDEHPSSFKSKFKQKHRLYCHDSFSDPLNWNTSANRNCALEAIIKTPFHLRKVLCKITNNESLKQSSGVPAKLGVIINSLSSLICQQDIASVCRDVFEILQWKTQACKVIQTVALVHSDLHDDNILSSVNYMASTIIELQKSPDNVKDGINGYFNVICCKKSGKTQRKKEAYCVNHDGQIQIIPFSENERHDQVDHYSQETPDVTSKLTFNLTLTDQQREARANLQLPYLLPEKTKKSQLDLGKKSQIFYQADEADDMDEEDPDDDLNI